jgi:hypothetical protein
MCCCLSNEGLPESDMAYSSNGRTKHVYNPSESEKWNDQNNDFNVNALYWVSCLFGYNKLIASRSTDGGAITENTSHMHSHISSRECPRGTLAS